MRRHLLLKVEQPEAMDEAGLRSIEARYIRVNSLESRVEAQANLGGI